MIAITANTIIAFRLPTSKRFAPKKVSCSYHMTILKNSFSLNILLDKVHDRLNIEFLEGALLIERLGTGVRYI